VPVFWCVCLGHLWWILLRPCAMVLNLCVECKFKHSKEMQWVCWKWYGGGKCWKFSTVLNVEGREIHVSRFRCLRGECAVSNVEREDGVDRQMTLGMLWLSYIIFITLMLWTQLFHCRLIFLFFIFSPKFIIFFSLWIETWFIW
jgi:hypothetical protein